MGRCGCVGGVCNCVIVSEDTDCIDVEVSGIGTNDTPYTVSATPILSPDAGNELECRANGLFTESNIETVDTNTVDLTGDGTLATPLQADAILVPDDTGPLAGQGDNLLNADALGLYVSCLDINDCVTGGGGGVTGVTSLDTDCIAISGVGTEEDPLFADLLINPAVTGCINCSVEGLDLIINPAVTGCFNCTNDGLTLIVDSDPDNIIECRSTGLFAPSASGGGGGGGSENLLSQTQSSFEDGTYGWLEESNVTISRTEDQAKHGEASLQLFAVGAGDMSIRTQESLGSLLMVAPDLEYTVQAGFRAATTGRDVRTNLRWHSGDGVFISEDTGATVTDTTIDWTIASNTATAPATAAYVVLELEVLSAAASGIHYVDEIGLFQSTSPTWVPPDHPGFDGLMPFRLTDGQIYVIPTNRQGLYVQDIELDGGTLDVEGLAIEVTQAPDISPLFHMTLGI